MAKLSVLDMVQDILSDMNSDEVNSITDTLESMQVAQIVKSVYEETMARKNWPHLKKLIQLSPLGASTPTHMALPVDIKELCVVSYNIKKAHSDPDRFEQLTWMEPTAFLEYTNRQNTAQASVDVITDPTNVSLVIRNDRAPTYYTTFDDKVIVCDSYNKTLETGLQASKTQCLAYIMPSLVLSDDVQNIPDMPVELFPAFLAECKSVCFARLKQVTDQKSEQQSRRGMAWMSKKAFQVSGGIRYPDYGRRGRK
jgi:hypothetical protein